MPVGSWTVRAKGDGVTKRVETDQDAGDDSLSDAYREAVGAVVAARTLYDQACKVDGPDSSAARQAEGSLSQEINHRNELREQYDRVLDQRPMR